MKKPYEILKDLLLSKHNVHVKLLGDSITHGVGGTGFEQNGVSFIEGFARNPDGYCWANKLKKHMEANYNCTVTNNGCTGTSIEFIINKFDILVDDTDDFIICTIGTNNRAVGFDQGPKPTREEIGLKFYNNVIKLCNMFRAANKEFVFVANIPAAPANEKDGENFWRILHMDDINAIYKKAAEKLGFHLISLYDLFSNYCESNHIAIESLLNDMLHPNDRGYDVMYDLLLEELHLN